MTLRGSILEDAVASTGRHGTARGLPLKEVLEQVVPELSISCLRLALSTPKVTEQLLKLDEQGVSYLSVFAFYIFGSCTKTQKNCSSTAFVVIFHCLKCELIKKHGVIWYAQLVCIKMCEPI